MKIIRRYFWKRSNRFLAAPIGARPKALQSAIGTNRLGCPPGNFRGGRVYEFPGRVFEFLCTPQNQKIQEKQSFLQFGMQNIRKWPLNNLNVPLGDQNYLLGSNGWFYLIQEVKTYKK